VQRDVKRAAGLRHYLREGECVGQNDRRENGTPQSRPRRIVRVRRVRTRGTHRAHQLRGSTGYSAAGLRWSQGSIPKLPALSEFCRRTISSNWDPPQEPSKTDASDFIEGQCSGSLADIDFGKMPELKPPSSHQPMGSAGHAGERPLHHRRSL